MNVVAIVAVVLGLVGVVTWAWRVEQNSALTVQLILIVGGLLYLAIR